VRIFQEGLELEVLKLSRGDFYRETLATSPRAVFDRLGAQEVLWGFWKPAGWKPPPASLPINQSSILGTSSNRGNTGEVLTTL